MVDLDVPEEELMVRLIKRGKDSGRADDNEETIKKTSACISFTDCSTDRLVQERKEIPTHQRLGYYGRYLR